MEYLIDTDIIIDYLRGIKEAIEKIEDNTANIYLSAMSIAELYQGVRNEKERIKLELTLSTFTILPITHDIAKQGGIFACKYRPSHGCGLADCLIAATVEEHALTLQTLNIKHYPMLQRIEIPYKKSARK